MDIEQVRGTLSRAVKKSGSVAAWARDNDVSPGYVQDAINGRREPGGKILAALGLVAVDRQYRAIKEPPTSSLQTQFDMTIEENRNQARHELDRIVSDYDGLRWAKRWGGPLIEAGYRDEDVGASDINDAEVARDTAQEQTYALEKAIEAALDAFAEADPDIPNIIAALEKAIQS